MPRPLSSSAWDQYRLHPDVVWLDRPDGSVRLMHLNANMCALDAEATSLLRSILDDGVARSVTILAENDHIAEAEAREQIDDFIAGLRGQKLIQLVRQRKSLRGQIRDGSAGTLIPAVTGTVERLMRGRRGKVSGLLWTARWAVAQFGWASAVRAWENVYPQPAPAEPNGAEPSGADQLDAIDHAVRDAASRSFMGFECKERSLACLALARGSGIPAELVVGVAHEPMRAHVWVEAQGRVISDDPEQHRLFEAVVRYGHQARLPQSAQRTGQR